MTRLCSSRYEREARKLGWMRIAGLDEVGRGSLFGPVVAAAVILNPKRRIVGLDDSKQIQAEKREVLAERIKEHAVAWAVAEIDSARIDAWNIYQASLQAMIAALGQLSVQPDYLLIDAMKLDVLIEQKSLIKGDAKSVSIAAASILAKTYRDARMQEFDIVYPQYGLAGHKGYALGVITEMMAGALTGGGASNPANAQRLANGMLSIYLDPKFFQDEGQYSAEVRRFVEWVKSSQKAQPNGEILMPGEIEENTKARRLRDGIELDDTTWKAISDTARSVGLDPEKV